MATTVKSHQVGSGILWQVCQAAHNCRAGLAHTLSIIYVTLVSLSARAFNASEMTRGIEHYIGGRHLTLFSSGRVQLV